MKVSLKWISEYVDISGISVHDLAEKLTVGGIEIEAIDYLAQANNLVIGKVLSCENHPSSDHLHVCKVDVCNEILQIVCGAPNVATGQKVIVAKVGADLKAKGVVIQKTTIRGVESSGMICSLLELGVDEKYLSKESIEGIEVLGEDAKIGETEVLSYLGYDDVSLELKLTPNRGDCLSVYSLAKEVGAILNRPVKPLVEPKFNEVPTNLTCKSDTQLCKIFKIKAVKGIKIKESPKYIKNYLMSCGIRSINNVVDIGNYVMLLTGQPLHMYDLDKVKSNEFIVKDQLEGDFVALDEKTYQLIKEDIVVTNCGENACLAGVMGADSTKIDDNTTNVAIEAAYFDSTSIRKTSRRLQLMSDSSTRFVRGIDLNRCNLALSLATNLLVELADAKVIEQTYSYDVVDHTLRVVTLTVNDVNKRLGTKFATKDVEDVLKALDFTYTLDGEEFKVIVPSYRNDITIAEDIIEEIIRLKGFDCLPLTLPTFATLGKLSERQAKRKLIRQHLASSGINETVNYTLEEPKYIEDFNIFNHDETIKLLNPMSEERSLLRKSLIPSLLHDVQYNLARNQLDVNLFEIASVYTKNTTNERIAIALKGTINNVRLYQSRQSDFYTIKGLVESIFTLLGIEQPRYLFERVEKDNAYYHPGKSVYIVSGRKKIGVIGLIHPLMAEKYDVGDVYVAEIDFDEIMAMKTNHVKFTPVIPYPPITRDLALVMKQEMEIGNVIRVIKKVGKNLITNIEVFDVYMGEHMEKGYKSVAVSLTYQDKTKTLVDKDVSDVQAKVIEALDKELGIKLRA
jgi:phenylalanyl-tRNA synthetase beta chain